MNYYIKTKNNELKKFNSGEELKKAIISFFTPNNKQTEPSDEKTQ